MANEPKANMLGESGINMRRIHEDLEGKISMLVKFAMHLRRLEHFCQMSDTYHRFQLFNERAVCYDI